MRYNIHMQFETSTESDMIALGEKIAQSLTTPCTIELIGDVGAGKTTLVKGLAKSLGITEEITSPSFVVSKKYTSNDLTLTHYDFYRLEDPGLMADELSESTQDPHAITIIEWAESVHGVLTPDRITIKISFTPSGGRLIELKNLELPT